MGAGSGASDSVIARSELSATTVALPENSEVCPPSVAVAHSLIPALTAPGVGNVNVNLLVLSVPWATPLMAPGPYVPVPASESA